MNFPTAKSRDFSLPFGTYVFLRSESAISRAVKSVVRDTLRVTEGEVASLFSRRAELSEAEWQRLNEQKELHRALATAGEYRSFVFSGISLLVPFIGPAVTLVTLVLKHLSSNPIPD
jgi:hypothetical protein